jgi:hypothetical protein
VGWIYFGGTVLLTTGIVHILNGLVALTRTGITVVAPSGTLVHLSLAGLGWSLLISGLVLAAVGAGIFTGQTWARVLGMVLAVLSILGNIAVFMAFPAWSALVITLDVVVLYALAAHGREINHHSTRA